MRDGDMSLYGEACYTCPICGAHDPAPRSLSQLERRDWAVHCVACQAPIDARPTPETKTLAPTSVYAISKRGQEEMTLAVGRSVGIPVIALRFFNVYGDRQSWSNPYTGAGAIFRIVNLGDVDSARGALLSLFREDQVPAVSQLERFTIRSVTKQLAETLDSACR